MGLCCFSFRKFSDCKAEEGKSIRVLQGLMVRLMAKEKLLWSKKSLWEGII